METLSYEDDWPLFCDNTSLPRNDAIAENLQDYADGMVKTNVSAAELLYPTRAQQNIAPGEVSLPKSDLDTRWYHPLISSANSTIDPPLSMLSNDSSPPRTVAPADILINTSMDLLYSPYFESHMIFNDAEGQASSAPTQVLGVPSRPTSYVDYHQKVHLRTAKKKQLLNDAMRAMSHNQRRSVPPLSQVKRVRSKGCLNVRNLGAEGASNVRNI